MLNLDTHILLHALSGDLTVKEEKALGASPWGISAIVLWEITKLAELGKITIDLDDKSVRKLLDKVHVWPLDYDVCLAIKKLDFKSDPADEIIAATSLVYNVPLVTRDQRIRKSRLVPLV